MDEEITVDTLVCWGYVDQSNPEHFKQAIIEGDRVRRHGGDETAIRQAIEFYVKKIPMSHRVHANSFELGDSEITQINSWNIQHDKECPKIPKNWKLDDLPPYGPIGGGRSYTLSPSSIGNFIEVKCVCGATFSVDSNW
jgi:hypothetical protein